MKQLKHKIICGDTIKVLQNIEKEFIDMVLTSPPYWGLRDYGEDTETNWNGWYGQLGLEPTPELYIEHLCMVFAEVKRVLKKTGTCWVNISDTYAGYWGNKNGNGTEYGNLPVHGHNQNKRGKLGELIKMVPWVKPKCMCMIPERFAIAMVENGWILRNKIIWQKPNPMPSSVKDRFNTTYEMLYFFSKSQKYCFDLDAVRKPYTEPLNRWGGNEMKIPEKTKWKKDDEKAKWCMSIGDKQSRPNPLGKNPGDLWAINTQPFPDAHFAVFPEKLCEKPILAGCPAEICSKCGMARMRITESHTTYESGSGKAGKKPNGKYKALEGVGVIGKNLRMGPTPHVETIGWTSCDCDADYESGIVLDPFSGSGTVGVVAEKLGRSSILIDIKPEYCEMAYKRLLKNTRQLKIDRLPSVIEKIGF